MQVRYSFLQVTLFLSCLLLLAHISNIAFAHEIRPAIVEIDLNEHEQDGTFKISIKLNLEAMISQVSADDSDSAELDNAGLDSDNSENAALYDQLRETLPEDLAQAFLVFEDFFLENMQLSFDDKAHALSVTNIDIPDIGDLDLARDSFLYLEGKIPKGSQTLSWKWDESFGNAALRINTLANPQLYSSYLLKGQASETVTFIQNNSLSQKNIKKGGGRVLQWGTFKNYLQVGFVHIIPKGIDHILFVVGLFLLSASLRPLLIQITTFTLAHSVTLALGIYGLVTIPASIIEPLIAASIVYIAIENIYLNHLSRWRPIIIFFFGLLHGLGFASVLTEIGLSSGYFATGLVAFNIGVELGQLTVIAACFLLFGFWFRNKPWYRQRITIPASIIIALIASYWFIERVGWV